MRLLFISADAFPPGRHVQDLVTLAKVLRRAEHKVDILSPLYSHIDTTKHSLARRLTKLEFELGGRAWSCELYSGRNHDGVELTFIGNDEMLLGAGSLSVEGHPLEASRVGVFASAAQQLIERSGRDYDVAHAHGWVGAAVVAKLASSVPDMPTVLTVYDADRQGRFDSRDADWLALGPNADLNAEVNVLKAGLLAADRVTTLSPNYAHRLQRPESENGLAQVFREIAPKTVGVRHGIDAAHWNSATDAHLPARFDPYDLEGKNKCKADLQHALALPLRSDIPLVAAIGRTEGDGLDLLAEIGPDLLRNDLQLVVQIDGGGELVAVFEELWDRWPDRIQIKTGADESMRHLLIGASDFLVVPGREAPTDNIQMRAQRYGSLPIVYREGGLADEVVDCEPSLNTGSGLLFDEPTPASLLSALQRAAAAFSNTKAFAELQSRVMRIDHSWERTIRLYERTYRDAMAANG